MKKYILSLVFIFTMGTSVMNANSSKSYDDPEGCYEFASEIAGYLAIWDNLSFEEEEAIFDELLTVCFEANT